MAGSSSWPPNASDDSPQIVEFSLVICCYDKGTDNEGCQDVANIKEAAVTSSGRA